MYAIKILSNFFHLIFHFTVKIDLEDALVGFILFRDAMMDTHELP